ncbi:MAG: hypothetical protein ACXACO_22515 [Promethearchaeota archaeon]|jgi:hypothetical protein
MKGLCYIVLIIGFFLFYQQNPVYAIVIIVIFVVGFLFVKSRKSGSGGGFGFLKGKGSQQNNHMNDLITIMMLQQLIGESSPKERGNERDLREDQIEKTKQEILDLLDE